MKCGVEVAQVRTAPSRVQSRRIIPGPEAGREGGRERERERVEGSSEGGRDRGRGRERV